MDVHPELNVATATHSLSDSDNEPGPTSTTKRGSRACDRCRKIKSKCQSADGGECKNCLVSGTPCTFQGPSFKRGPPKGYIHAIEQHWQQVECILATIMSSPRAEGIINDLRHDTFARSVLDGVEAGPYGQNRRSHQVQGAQAVTPESFYDAFMGSDLGATYEDRRSRRQSRVSREIVSVQADTTSDIPTLDWQKQLSDRLAHSSGFTSPSLTSLSSPVTMSTSTPDSSSSEPSRRRARLDGMRSMDTTARGPHDMYTLGDSYYEDYKSTVGALGHLSVNENQDIRYHDQSAGLHLIARTARNDDSQTKEDGIWKFHSPMEGASSHASRNESHESISWPPAAVQDHLINLYFTYVHPFFPVIHKSTFLTLYHERKFSHHSRYSKTIQGISDLLLLSMFAFSARYWDDEFKKHPSVSHLHEQVAEGGRLYAVDARRVLNNVYQHSRPSTCQALLLMGVREFGIGSMEQGWLFVGMAGRMAVDLGMNHNADEWKNSKGQFLFSVPDRHARQQIWAGCCIADKLSSIWLGRPVTFREYDWNVDYPSIVEEDEEEEWRPYPADALGPDFHAEPSRIMSYYREQSKISLIMAQIMTKIYPVKPSTDTPKRVELERLESRLHHWLFELPNHLRYEAGRRATPLPHIMALHIEYHFAVLLLHRAFIPNWNDPVSSSNPGLETDTLPLKSLDLCQGAASHISSMIYAFHEYYGLNRCPPLFNTFLQGAGIMHVVALMRRPGNTEGTIGLMRCIDAAKAMEPTWPCATEVRHLLEGAHVQLDDISAWSHGNQAAQSSVGKRPLEDALGTERNSDVLPWDLFNIIAPGYHPLSSESRSTHQQQHGDQSMDESARLFAQTSSLPVFLPQAPMPFYPGFEWWPQSMMNTQQYERAEGTQHYFAGRQQQQLYPPPQGTFTFDEGQMSSTFTDQVGRDDVSAHGRLRHSNC